MFNTSPKKRHAGPSKERVSTERKDPLNIRHLPSSNHNKGPGKKSFQKMFINKMCLEHSKAVRDQHGAKTSAMNSPDHSSKFFYLSPESKFRQSLHDDAFTAQFGKRSSIFEDSRPINIESHPNRKRRSASRKFTTLKPLMSSHLWAFLLSSPLRKRRATHLPSMQSISLSKWRRRLQDKTTI